MTDKTSAKIGVKLIRRLTARREAGLKSQILNIIQIRDSNSQNIQVT